LVTPSQVVLTCTADKT